SVTTGGTGTTSINAAALSDGNLLTVSGTDVTTVTGLQGDLDAGALSGNLSVTTADAATISITTSGAGTTSINASALGNDNTLIVSGTDNTTITGLKGDLDASGLDGTLSVTTADNATDQDISVITGTNTTTITGNSLTGAALDTVNGNATALGDDITLNLIGNANFNVDALQGDLNASAASGTVSVTTADASTISVTTGGTGTTSINAAALSDGNLLTVSGRDVTTVTGLQGDLDASALDGNLSVTTADNATDQDISVITGTNTTTITGNSLTGAALDTVNVNATALGDDITLNLIGNDNFNVDALQGDLNASAASGTVSVTTADASTISVTTGGTGTTSINAAALSDGNLLTVSGTDVTTVTGLQGDLDAGALSGNLSVTTADAAT